MRSTCLTVTCRGNPVGSQGKAGSVAGAAAKGWSRRRVLAVGEAALEIAGACAFEARFHASASASGNGGVAGTLTSLLPTKTSPELEQQAKASAERPPVTHSHMFAALAM